MIAGYAKFTIRAKGSIHAEFHSDHSFDSADQSHWLTIDLLASFKPSSI